MATNFFGPLTLTRLILPSMRLRHSGTVVQISSATGLEAKPSRSLYSASKFALEAFSEALYHEVKPLGIHVLLVEPGWFGTNFSRALARPEAALRGSMRGRSSSRYWMLRLRWGVWGPGPRMMWRRGVGLCLML